MNQENLRNTHVRSQVKRIPHSNSGEYSNGEAHWFLGWRQKQASHPHSSPQCSKFKELMQLHLPWCPLHFKHATGNRHLTSRNKYKSNPKHFNVDSLKKIAATRKFAKCKCRKSSKVEPRFELRWVFSVVKHKWFLGIRKIQISHLLHSSSQWSKNRRLNSTFKSQKIDLHFHMLRKWGAILSKTTISHPTQSTKHLNVDSNKNTNSFSTPNLEPDPHQSRHFHLEQPKISGTKESQLLT